MILKTDYQDDMFEGTRTWRISQNADGTSNITDATTYTQEGTRFGANDVNTTNREINRMNRMLGATLTAAGWSSAAPYTQTVSIEGILDTDKPVIECATDLTSKAQKRALQKAWDMVDRIVTGDGEITAYCQFDKPEMDIPLVIKGV